MYVTQKIQNFFLQCMLTLYNSTHLHMDTLYLYSLSTHHRCRCSKCGYSCLREQVDHRYRLSLRVTRDTCIFGVTVFGSSLNPFFGIHASGLQRWAWKMIFQTSPNFCNLLLCEVPSILYQFWVWISFCFVWIEFNSFGCSVISQAQPKFIQLYSVAGKLEHAKQVQSVVALYLKHYIILCAEHLDCSV